MFENLKGHTAQFIKSLILIVGIVGTALPAKAEIIHFDSLDLTQARSKNLDDPYERRFTAPINMEITSIELKLSENRDSEPLAFSSVTISIDGLIFTYSSHDATAGTITLIGHAELSAGDVATMVLGGFLQSGTAKAQINGSSETKAVSAVFYGSYVLSDAHYLQAAIGHSKLDIDKQRISAGIEYGGSRDGDSTHLLLSAARRLPLDVADILIALETRSQMTELAAYAEKDGPNAYHYMMQKVRHNHIGLRARINETFDFDLGDLKLTGEFGYQADLSESSKAQAYQLSDSRLIFTHDVSDKDEDYSSSHSMVSFGADLTGNNGWTYSAKGRLQKYKTGNIGSLSLQAAYRF